MDVSWHSPIISTRTGQRTHPGPGTRFHSSSAASMASTVTAIRVTRNDVLVSSTRAGS
ncbi:hypothetical protein ACWDA9_23215 [Streptomyces sp. NPDC001193]